MKGRVPYRELLRACQSGGTVDGGRRRLLSTIFLLSLARPSRSG